MVYANSGDLKIQKDDIIQQFEVSIAMPGYTTTAEMNEELTVDFLAGLNSTMQAEGSFEKGINSVVSASVSGENDDIDEDEAKVFVRVKLNVSAKTKGDAERIALSSNRLLAQLADMLAEQAEGSIELDTGEPDLDDIEQMQEPATCNNCDSEVEQIIGCPDGSEICQSCFDAGFGNRKRSDARSLATKSNTSYQQLS